jgi:prephenate dehydrogenase
LGVVDEGFDSLEPAVKGASLVIVCTPVGFMETIIRQLDQLLEPGTLVTDVGSTKRSIVKAGEGLLRNGAKFVGSHPMAGGEQQGAENARAELLNGALCILTPTEHTDAVALAQVQQFWMDLGMRTTTLGPSEHDERLAQVSHLPHAVAAALVAMQQAATLPLAGNGFLDTTRIASGGGAMWRDILIDNRDSVKAALKLFRGQLEEMEALLDPKRSNELAAWLDRAAAKRNDLMRRESDQRDQKQ